MDPIRWTTQDGWVSPFGVHWDEQGKVVNFSLNAQGATRVELLLYSADDFVQPVIRCELDYARTQTNKSWAVWHCRMSRDELVAAGARYYAYRVDGPRADPPFKSFDPDKIILDPWALSVFFPPGLSRQAAIDPGPNDGKAPLGVLIHPEEHYAFDWGADPRPRHDSDLIIYEMHVRGFSKRAPDVQERNRGTFAGVIEKIPHLKELGVTAVELMPVHEGDPGETDYWGYMPLNFFAPKARYTAADEDDKRLDRCEQLSEFRGMVKALHEAGIEVFLDVVYNHTTEGNENGPTYSYRGLAHNTYYVLTPQGYYVNDTGTGNTLHSWCTNVRRLIMDSMRFWVRDMHVDGFRFDLASVLTRNRAGTFDREDQPLIDQIGTEPSFAPIRLIAEPWDIRTYQLGTVFPGRRWFQWNGKFRDVVRGFIKGDGGLVNELMLRLYGSDDLFPDTVADASRPFQSVNFITAHDGFCLYDLVSYNEKHNLANGHNNTDGADDNRSWNCGFEGDDGVPAEVMDLRRRQVRNFCALLMLANGTPMFVAGDEFMNTQKGNNNPFNQDNETTWLDWGLKDKNRDVLRFFQLMIKFRKEHPSIARGRFWRGDVAWFGTTGAVDHSATSHTLSFYLDGAAVGDDDLYVMINAFWEDLPFQIQRGQPGEWSRIVDTGKASPDDFRTGNAVVPLTGVAYPVKARSVVVLVRPRK